MAPPLQHQNATPLTSPYAELASAVAKTLRETGSAMDAAMPKLLSLSNQERHLLSLQVSTASAMLQSAVTMADPFQQKPDSRVEALDAVSRLLSDAYVNIPPKEYEAAVKQAWKRAQLAIGPMLSSVATKAK